MKILYLVSNADIPGGVMSIVSRKINYLSTKGYDVKLYSMAPCGQVFYKFNKSVELIYRNKINGNNKVKGKDLINAIKFIKSSSFDIIISADAKYITWCLPFITRTPKIVELHQSYDGLRFFFKDGCFSPILNILFYILRKCIYPMYDRVVVLTEEDKIKWKFKNSTVIPNFHNLKIKSQTFVNNKRLISIGRFQYQKGYDLLIQVIKKIVEKKSDIKLYFYGVKPSKQHYKILEENKVLPYFILEPFEKDLSKIYNDSYLNIVSSRSESFSLTTLESMCFGVPTVSFDITGPHSLILDKSTGCLIEPYDTEKMAEEIIYLLENPEERDKMSKMCLERAEFYTMENIMPMWLNLFNNL